MDLLCFLEFLSNRIKKSGKNEFSGLWTNYWEGSIHRTTCICLSPNPHFGRQFFYFLNLNLTQILPLIQESSLKRKCNYVLSAWNWSRSVVPDSLQPPGQNTGMGSLSLLQGIFPTQGSNPGLPHCRQILYQLSHQGSPRRLEWVAYPSTRGSSRPRNRTRVSCIAGRFFTSWAIREAHRVHTIAN